MGCFEKQQDRFVNVCTGSDKCPTEAGLLINNGCPVEDPDIDKDSLCAPWVKEKECKINSRLCKGIDNCPTEFGLNLMAVAQLMIRSR